MICGVGCRCGSDPVLLWLWCRPAATALIPPLAWELPYGAGAAIKKKKNVIRMEHGNQFPVAGFPAMLLPGLHIDLGEPSQLYPSRQGKSDSFHAELCPIQQCGAPFFLFYFPPFPPVGSFIFPPHHPLFSLPPQSEQK